MLPEKLNEFGIRGRDVGKLKKDGEIKIDEKIIKVEDCGEFKRGQVIAFIMDTRLCDNAYKLAENADLLICESTYLKSETADAKKNGHLTATQAAEIAKNSNANLLALTHFSQRYLRTDDFLREAKLIHENCIAMKDGDFVDLPKRS
jgi:ribonuclease Z